MLMLLLAQTTERRQSKRTGMPWRSCWSRIAAGDREALAQLYSRARGAVYGSGFVLCKKRP